MKWFRDYWKQKGQNVKESGNTQRGLKDVPVVEGDVLRLTAWILIFCLILIFWGGIAWSIGTFFYGNSELGPFGHIKLVV